MKKNLVKLLSIISFWLLTIPLWGQVPSQCKDVMLQAFFWDSYADTKWTNLTSQAEEISKSFDMMWVPQSGYSGSGNNMGYMPQYFFKQSSSFGSEAELRTMIQAYKARNCKMIADIVINHRNGVNGWVDFPVETYKGKTYSWDLSTICSNDNAGSYRPTGQPDTGTDFDGCRDIDHYSPVVQSTIIDYLNFLKDDIGYAGWRYDMVKGYDGKFNKIYNDASKPYFSVGECWDNYDVTWNWIKATQYTSTAFDFPCRDAIKDAFDSNDMRKLVWKANGTTDQPAGLIHHEQSKKYAVTFVDNHDTGREQNKFSGNIAAANAFIICSPGVPCVWLPHWKSNKTEIQRMIEARKSVGIHSESAVRVLKSTTNAYAAELTGTDGKLIVKIGNDMTFNAPAGYNMATSGNDYCIWTTKATVNPDPNPNQQGITVSFFKPADWTTVNIWAWQGTSNNIFATWPGQTMKDDGNGWWSYTFDKSINPINVVFSNTNGNPQSVDINDISTSTYFYPRSIVDNKVTIEKRTSTGIEVLEGNDNFNIQYMGDNEIGLSLPQSTTKIIISSLLGKQLESVPFSSQQQTISLSIYSSGIYLITAICNNGKSITKKVIKK